MAAWDLAILGGGPGGYVAAIRAAQLGMKVLVVEKDALGGICANWGCIPTKALLRSAELIELLRHADELGVSVENVKPDFGKTIARSRTVAGKQEKGVAFLFKKNKIEHVKASGKLALQNGRARLIVDGKPIDAKNVIVATGARPRGLPGLEHDGKLIISYHEAMSLETQPKTLVIIGAGAIGVEFAYYYNQVGTKVTLIEAMPQILPIEDGEVSAAVQKSFSKQGIDVLVGAKVGSVKPGPGGVVVDVTDGKGARTINADLCLLAVGVRGNSDGIGLEEVGVKLERGFIAIDHKTYATSAPGIYAIGDVVGGAMLAHKASAEGVACVEGLAGHSVHAVDYDSIPGCTYCRPEVASVGLTEERAKKEGLKFKVGRFPFKASGKAMAASETEGFVKVIIGEPYGEILGAHFLGGAATDMVATLTLAKTAELTADEILTTVFAHPTFAEAIKESVADAFGEAIDI